MVIALGVEVFSEEVIGKFTSLGEAVDAFPDIEVYPTVFGKLVEVLFGNELLWDTSKFDAEVFVLFEGSVEIKMFDVKNG